MLDPPVDVGRDHVLWPADAELTPRGVEQAHALGRSLCARRLALVYTSRLTPAVQTAAIVEGNKDSALASYKTAVPEIDTLVNKQIIHRNKAARHKSRLAARIRAMQ